MAEKKMDMSGLVSTMQEWFSKLPALPKSATDVMVKIAPWLALIFGVLGLLALVSGIIGLFGLGMFGAAMMPYGGYAVAGASFMGVVYLLLAIVPAGLELLAFPGLKAQKMVGWNYLFYSMLASTVIGVITGGVYGLVGVLVGAVIGFYLLFQVKSYYK